MSEELEQYSDDDFDFDEEKDDDGSVVISRKELEGLRELARAKGPIADLRTQIRTTRTTEELMNLLDSAGVATSWNRQ